ncbi:hypothetical protein B0J14DRAFT_653757 [Halenospora varia]|nr:hypothetical protein B0J14DRAFT_653757 [Halenospora varia]
MDGFRLDFIHSSSSASSSSSSRKSKEPSTPSLKSKKPATPSSSQLPCRSSSSSSISKSKLNPDNHKRHSIHTLFPPRLWNPPPVNQLLQRPEIQTVLGVHSRPQNPSVQAPPVQVTPAMTPSWASPKYRSADFMQWTLNSSGHPYSPQIHQTVSSCQNAFTTPKRSSTLPAPLSPYNQKLRDLRQRKTRDQVNDHSPQPRRVFVPPTVVDEDDDGFSIGETESASLLSRLSTVTGVSGYETAVESLERDRIPRRAVTKARRVGDITAKSKSPTTSELDEQGFSEMDMRLARDLSLGGGEVVAGGMKAEEVLIPKRGGRKKMPREWPSDEGEGEGRSSSMERGVLHRAEVLRRPRPGPPARSYIVPRRQLFSPSQPRLQAWERPKSPPNIRHIAKQLSLPSKSLDEFISERKTVGLTVEKKDAVEYALNTLSPFPAPVADYNTYKRRGYPPRPKWGTAEAEKGRGHHVGEHPARKRQADKHEARGHQPTEHTSKIHEPKPPRSRQPQPHPSTSSPDSDKDAISLARGIAESILGPLFSKSLTIQALWEIQGPQMSAAEWRAVASVLERNIEARRDIFVLVKGLRGCWLEGFEA